MPNRPSLEVFQDLFLRGPSEERGKLRDALINEAAPPWRHASDKEADISLHATDDDDVLVFERSEGDGLAAAGLVLWSTADGYKITNIVPLEVNSLSYSAYNAILQDFGSRLARPAAIATGFQIETSAAHESINDWLAPSSAEALRRFSTLANKSTGAAHPLDKERWLAFLIDVYRRTPAFDADRLVRWLIEVERWPEGTAHDLAIQYEFAIELLEHYDRTR